MVTILMNFVRNSVERTTEICIYVMLFVTCSPNTVVGVNNHWQVVVTIWYRAPELLLGAKHYTSAVGMKHCYQVLSY